MWSNEVPTKPGYYWWKFRNIKGNPRIVKIIRGEKGLLVTYFGTEESERPGISPGVFWPEPIGCPDGSSPFIV